MKFEAACRPPPPPSSSPSPTNNYYEVVPDDMDYSPNPVVLDTSDPEDENQDDFYENLQDDDQIIGSVAEQVEAQLQNKSVAQLRREEAQRARDNFVAKPKGKRGRKKKRE